jgi:hypothetical protein
VHIVRLGDYQSISSLSKHALARELAARRGQAAEMNQQFTTAIQLEDKLPYMEPPYWHHPVRQIYGVHCCKAEKQRRLKRRTVKT